MSELESKKTKRPSISGIPRLIADHSTSSADSLRSLSPVKQVFGSKIPTFSSNMRKAFSVPNIEKAVLDSSPLIAKSKKHNDDYIHDENTIGDMSSFNEQLIKSAPALLSKDENNWLLSGKESNDELCFDVKDQLVDTMNIGEADDDDLCFDGEDQLDDTMNMGEADDQSIDCRKFFSIITIKFYLYGIPV